MKVSHMAAKLIIGQMIFFTIRISTISFVFVIMNKMNISKNVYLI